MDVAPTKGAGQGAGHDANRMPLWLLHAPSQGQEWGADRVCDCGCPQELEKGLDMMLTGYGGDSMETEEDAAGPSEPQPPAKKRQLRPSKKARAAASSRTTGEPGPHHSRSSAAICYAAGL